MSLNSILLLGSGGREHALATKLAMSAKVGKVYVAPGNGGTQIGNAKIENVAIASDNLPALGEFAQTNNISMVVVGPEAPLVIGAVDHMNALGIPCFGPTQAAAELENSKAYSKDFMARHHIPTARYENFKSKDQAIAYVESIDFPVVVKASGLAAGKGVIIPANKEETIKAIEEIMGENQLFGSAGAEVVIEEFLEGEEVSVLAFCDGNTVKICPGAQDHKRALDNDEGLNTGGMGCYCPAPLFTPTLRKKCEELCARTVWAMKYEGKPYVGILFAGFMISSVDGEPYVLEYNCRFGDPETEVVLPLLESDLYDVFDACCNGKLEDVELVFRDAFATTVVLAAAGYPEKYPKGMPIEGLDNIAQQLQDVTVYHAGTKFNSETNQIVANGGRVLTVTGVGATLQESIQKAYDGINMITMTPSHFRKDIAAKALNKPIYIGVLGSTRGSALQPVIDAINAKELNAKIQVIVTNKADAGIIARARKHRIPSHIVSAKGLKRDEYDAKVTTVLQEYGCDLILMVGYMRIVSPSFCQVWENRCMNVHPSLLPDFAGGMDLEVHKAVIEAGKKESGCTVHMVTEEVDGGPICVQERVVVEDGETPESLKAKVQPLEGTAFIKAIKGFVI